jgi:hypothetical protein
MFWWIVDALLAGDWKTLVAFASLLAALVIFWVI